MLIQTGPSMCFICGYYTKGIIDSSHMTTHFQNGELPTKYKIMKYSLLYKFRSFLDKIFDKV